MLTFWKNTEAYEWLLLSFEFEFVNSGCASIVKDNNRSKSWNLYIGINKGVTADVGIYVLKCG